MFQSKKTLITAFIFPILILMGMLGIHSFYLRTSEQRVFPIRGYDPRDLLSGHYLIFSVDYGVRCSTEFRKKAQEKMKKGKRKCPIKTHLCLEPEKKIGFFHEPNKECSLFIKGTCSCYSSVFSVEGANRYYVPEEHAKELEKFLIHQNHKREVVLSITKKGNVMVKDILINDKPIKSWIK